MRLVEYRIVAGEDRRTADHGKGGKVLALSWIVAAQVRHLIVQEAILVDLDFLGMFRLVDGRDLLFVLCLARTGDIAVKHQNWNFQAARFCIDLFGLQCDWDDIDLGHIYVGCHAEIDLVDGRVRIGVEVLTVTIDGAHPWQLADRAQSLVDFVKRLRHSCGVDCQSIAAGLSVVFKCCCLVGCAFERNASGQSECRHEN